MIRICHITSKHAAFDTRIFFKECKTLKAYYSVVLLGANVRNEMINGIEISGFKYVAGKTLLNYISIFRAALKQKASTYHIHDAELLPLAFLLKIIGKKIIYDVHENYRELMIEHHHSRLKQKVFAFFDNWAAKNCALILAERSYISIYQQRAKNICVVENFCDIEALKSFVISDRTECNKMLYIGTIHSHRGALVMLEVLHILRLRGLDIMLDMVGKISESNLMETMERLPFYFKIKSRVTWHGQLNLSDSYRVAEQSFVGLCMIEDLPNHAESYPTKLFEYMAVGLPIVATNLSLYRAVVELRECGICAPFTDVNAIADAIEKIYIDKELLKQFSTNGPITVAQNYNWNSERNILLDFYRKVVGVGS